MGRIKTQLIKRTTEDLLEKSPQDYSTDFNENKTILRGKVEIPSKKMRNTIAGYTARLVKQKTKAENEPRKRMSEEDLSKFYQ